MRIQLLQIIFFLCVLKIDAKFPQGNESEHEINVIQDCDDCPELVLMPAGKVMLQRSTK